MQSHMQSAQLVSVRRAYRDQRPPLPAEGLRTSRRFSDRRGCSELRMKLLSRLSEVPTLVTTAIPRPLITLFKPSDMPGVLDTTLIAWSSVPVNAVRPTLPPGLLRAQPGGLHRGPAAEAEVPGRRGVRGGVPARVAGLRAHFQPASTMLLTNTGGELLSRHVSRTLAL